MFCLKINLRFVQELQEKNEMPYYLFHKTEFQKNFFEVENLWKLFKIECKKCKITHVFFKNQRRNLSFEETLVNKN